MFITPIHQLFAANGTWVLNANGNWSLVTNWNASVVASGSTFSADFSTLNITADRTVTLDAPYTITNVLFGDATTPSNNWIVSGANILTLAAPTPTVTVTNQTATISSVVAGTAGMVKAGAGQLILGGANTFTGATVVNAGTLKAGILTTAFGSNTPLTLANSAGVLLDLGNYSNTIGSLAGGGLTGGDLALGTGTLTLGNDNSSTTFSGIVSGSGGITKAGTGTFTVAGLNTYTGATSITAGSLRAGTATSAFGNNSAVSTLNVAGVLLDLNANNNAVGSLAGGGALGGGVSLGASALTIGGNNTNTSFAGIITGSGGIVKNGTGIQIFTGANTYTGTTIINNGSLTAGVVTSAFGNGSAVSLANNANTALDLSTFSNTVGSISGGGATGGNLTLGTGTLTSGGDNSSTNFGGIISGTGGMIKNGNGVLTLLR